jgi:hypothetical protein
LKCIIQASFGIFSILKAVGQLEKPSSALILMGSEVVLPRELSTTSTHISDDMSVHTIDVAFEV